MIKNSKFIRNYKEVFKINNNILKQTSFICSIILGILFILSSLVLDWDFLMPLYSIGCIVSIITYIISKFVIPKYLNLVLPLVYFYSTYFFFSAIYLGIFFSPNDVAVTFICLLIIVPILYLDKQWRIRLNTVIMSMLFCLLTFIYKPFEIAIADIVDCIVFCIIGLFIGQIICSVRLENIEMQRKLIKQRDTDMLTKLGNRRKLFDTIENWDSNNCFKELSTIIMIDIDRFKKYNDTYGHQKGDACLRQLGKCFLAFFQKFNLKIFRYGGEEFIALGEINDYETVKTICENLLQTVESQHIIFEDPPAGYISISIGFAINNAYKKYNCEELINIADCSLYKAKELGRNRVIGYLD